MYDCGHTYDIYPYSIFPLFLSSFCTVDMFGTVLSYFSFVCMFVCLFVFFFGKYFSLFCGFQPEQLIILSKCA